jgi:predicted DNA-binding protein
MVRTQIQLTEVQVTMLKEVALRQKRSMAQIIREAIDHMADTGELEDREKRRKRALNAAGRFHSGLKNLSENHDQYLSTIYKS